MASSLDPQRAALIATFIDGGLAGAPRGTHGAGISIPQDIAPRGEASSAYRHALFGAENQALQLAFLLPDRSPPHQSAVWRPLLLPLALIPLLGILVAMLSWRRLLRPIALLPELLAAASAGDVHRAMPVEGGNLTRAIALAFNRLMAALQQRFVSDDRASADQPDDVDGQDKT